jgi:hypothetical protein
VTAFHATGPFPDRADKVSLGAKLADFSKRSERDLRLRFTVFGG